MKLNIIYGHSCEKLKPNDKVAFVGATHKWEAFVKETTGQLQCIEYVDFGLHSSFPEPHRKIHSPPFKISEQGWGEFEMEIIIHFKKTFFPSSLTVKHIINFPPPGKSRIFREETSIQVLKSKLKTDELSPNKGKSSKQLNSASTNNPQFQQQQQHRSLYLLMKSIIKEIGVDQITRKQLVGILKEKHKIDVLSQKEIIKNFYSKLLLKYSSDSKSVPSQTNLSKEKSSLGPPADMKHASPSKLVASTHSKSSINNSSCLRIFSPAEMENIMNRIHLLQDSRLVKVVAAVKADGNEDHSNNPTTKPQTANRPVWSHSDGSFQFDLARLSNRTLRILNAILELPSST